MKSTNIFFLFLVLTTGTFSSGRILKWHSISGVRLPPLGAPDNVVAKIKPSEKETYDIGIRCHLVIRYIPENYLIQITVDELNLTDHDYLSITNDIGKGAFIKGNTGFKTVDLNYTHEENITFLFESSHLDKSSRAGRGFTVEIGYADNNHEYKPGDIKYVRHCVATTQSIIDHCIDHNDPNLWEPLTDVVYMDSFFCPLFAQKFIAIFVVIGLALAFVLGLVFVAIGIPLLKRYKAFRDSQREKKSGRSNWKVLASFRFPEWYWQRKAIAAPETINVNISKSSASDSVVNSESCAQTQTISLYNISEGVGKTKKPYSVGFKQIIEREFESVNGVVEGT